MKDLFDKSNFLLSEVATCAFLQHRQDIDSLACCFDIDWNLHSVWWWHLAHLDKRLRREGHDERVKCHRLIIRHVWGVSVSELSAGLRLSL